MKPLGYRVKQVSRIYRRPNRIWSAYIIGSQEPGIVMLHRTHARQPTNINNDLRISRLKFLNNEEMEKKHKFLYDNDDFVNNFSFFFFFLLFLKFSILSEVLCFMLGLFWIFKFKNWDFTKSHQYVSRWTFRKSLDIYFCRFSKK